MDTVVEVGDTAVPVMGVVVVVEVVGIGGRIVAASFTAGPDGMEGFLPGTSTS